jgi:peptidoglycan hydrolase-like protein with peptidoglycan-binding domain
MKYLQKFKSLFFIVFLGIFGLVAFANAQGVTVTAVNFGTNSGNSACPTFSTNMWQGNKYNKPAEVLKLQNFLFQHFGASLNSTGYFGIATKHYLQKFQKEQGLNATGNLGQLTRAKILSMCNEQIFCPAVYQPVCGQTKQNTTPKTYGNSCELSRDGATTLYNGECKEYF